MEVTPWISLLVTISVCLLASQGHSLPVEYRERRFLESLFGHHKNSSVHDDNPLEDIIEGLKKTLEIPASKVIHKLEDLGKNIDKWSSKLEDIGTKIVPGLLSKLTPTEYLEKFGYLKKTLDGKHSVGALISGLVKFQKMFHKSAHGLLDMDTINAMLHPRCGMPDLLSPVLEEIGSGISKFLPVQEEEFEKRFNAKGPKWRKTALTWKIQNYTDSPSITRTVQHDAIKAGLQYWQDVSGLTFTETSGTADLNMRFVPASHGDGAQNNFDGPGGVLAHAFFPESGEAHYDITEEWTDGVSRGINLKIVTAHEIGHALGLGHSEVEGALMAPYYQGYVPDYKLPQDDISGIQALYGKNTAVVAQPRLTPAPATPAPATPAPATPAPATSTSTLRPTPPTQPPTQSSSQPNTCTIPFRAITQIHDYRVFVFYGDWAWRISENGLDAGFPQKINTIYKSAPSNIEAAVFTFKHYFTYFFKGNQVWVYYGYELVGHKTIMTSGYPTSLQAAVTAPDQSIYLLQGSSVWKFDEESLDIVSSTPSKIFNVFPGAPYLFDSVFRFHDDTNLFFFRGDYYYKYSETYQAQVSGYPKKKAIPWFGNVCNV